MLHAKFRGNRPAGSGEEDLHRDFNIYGHGGHFGHVTSIMSLDFHFLEPESFQIQNLVQIDKVVSQKIRFEFVYVHHLVTKSSNDIDLQYSHTFIYLIRCLLLPTFGALAAIVSEKSIFFHFFYRKPMLPNLTLL